MERDGKRMDRKLIVLRENWKFHLEEEMEKEHSRDFHTGSPGQEGYLRSAAAGAWYKGFDDSGWRSVTVPHDWSVEQPFSKRYSSGTGYLAGGTGWYRVHFRLPEGCRGKSLRVVFDGVYKNSQVWCNSYYLGRRPYGYSTFSYDITHAAAFGDEENVLSVKVVHTDLADSRWFTGSGITRKVTLIIEEPAHPAEYGVLFRAEQVEADGTDPERGIGRARIVVCHRTEEMEGLSTDRGAERVIEGILPGAGRTVLPALPERDMAQRDGRTGQKSDWDGPDTEQAALMRMQMGLVRIRTALIGAEGETVLTMEGVTGTGGECILSGTLERARLWSPEHPYLYTLRTWYRTEGARPAEEELSEEGFYLADETRVGIRGIAFDPDRGFFLNGAETKLKGVCVHHDGGALGAAMEPEVWQRRLEALRECGCNAIRCSHNPHMPELYDLCDRMGFLVMDEAFDEWENAKNKWSTGHNVYPPVHEGYFEAFPAWHEADLRAMVRRDRNHPSVVLWSIGNEIDYPNDPYCHPSFASMTGNNDAHKPAAERQYDPNKPNALRLVSIADKLEQIVREEDDTRPVTLAAAFPELSSETGLFRGLDVVGYNYKEHLYAKDHGRFPEKPFLGSENGHGYGAWLAVRDNPYISGQFLWTGIDYLGEARGWPVHGSPAGILTCAGDRKPEFYRRKSFWQKAPVLAIATRRASEGEEDWLPMESHWNYEPGEEILVKVYSNLPKVRLVLEAWEPGGQGGMAGLPVSGAEGTEAGESHAEAAGAVQRASGEQKEAQRDVAAALQEAAAGLGQSAGTGQEVGVLEGYNGDGAYCFRVSYRPGTLTAFGYGTPEGAARASLSQACSKDAEPICLGRSADNEAELDMARASGADAAASCSLSTVGCAAGLDCGVWQQPDALTGRGWEEASGEPGYLYQLEIGLRDENGRPVSWQERLLTVTVEGAGALAGLESGNLADVTPYSQNSRTTFRGRLLAFVRRNGQGEIVVKIAMEEGGACISRTLHGA